MDDNNIIQLFFERSQEAIVVLSEKYGKLCNWIAMNILKNYEDAQECENDTYLKVWDSIPPTYPENLAAYISRITRNLALSRYRHNQRKKRSQYMQVYLSELEDCIPDTRDTEIMADDTVVRLIESFLKQQKQLNRIVFVRRYFYMESITEIAQKYGLTESNVSTKLHRTRVGLRKFLEQEGVSI